MKKLMLPAAICVALASAGPPAEARDVTKFVDDLGDASFIYYTGVMYRPGMKITRPGAYNDGGYAYGSFALIDNTLTNAPTWPGGGKRFLDGGTTFQDFDREPWVVEFDMPVKSFSVTGYSGPGWIMVNWIKAYDATGTLVAEQRVKVHSYETGTVPLKMATRDGSNTIAKVEFSYQTAPFYGSPYPNAGVTSWEMLTWEVR